jgi:hypothetical protein
MSYSLEEFPALDAPYEHVPLIDAMLVWNRHSDQVRIVRHPDTEHRWHAYRMSTLACFAGWRKIDAEERLCRLLMAGWIAVLRDGVDPIAMHHALNFVPEYRDACPCDMPTISHLHSSMKGA